MELLAGKVKVVPADMPCQEFASLAVSAHILYTVCSDEAYFHLSEFVSKQNMRFWASRNTHSYEEWLRTGRRGDWGLIPGRGKRIFSCSLCVQTGSGAHPASCTMGTGGPFPGGKARPGRDADHSPPSSAEVENE